MDVFHELEKILTHPTLLLQLGERAVQNLYNKLSRMSEALIVGGDQHAEQLGEDLGSVIADVGFALAAAGTVKAGEILAEAGINLSKDVLEGMATSKANKLSKADAIASARELNNFYLDGGFPTFFRTKSEQAVALLSGPILTKQRQCLGLFKRH